MPQERANVTSAEWALLVNSAGMATKTESKIASPVEMLGQRKRDLEAALQKADRDIRAAARHAERLASKREALLIELRGIEEAIEKLGGLPKDA